jgi:hypothetical protein
LEGPKKIYSLFKGYKSRIQLANEILSCKNNGMFNHQKKLLKIHRHDKTLSSISKKFIAQDKKNLLNEKSLITETIKDYLQTRENNSKKISSLLESLKKEKRGFYFQNIKSKEISMSSQRFHFDLNLQLTYLKNEIRKLEIQKFVESVKYFYVYKDKDQCDVKYLFILSFKRRNIFLSLDEKHIFYPLIKKLFGEEETLWEEKNKKSRFYFKMPFKFFGDCQSIKRIIQNKILTHERPEEPLFLCHSCCLNFKKKDLFQCRGKDKIMNLNSKNLKSSSKSIFSHKEKTIDEKIPSKFLLRKRIDDSFELITLNKYLSLNPFMNYGRKNLFNSLSEQKSFKSVLIKQKWKELEFLLSFLNETETDTQKLLTLSLGAKNFFSKKMKESVTKLFASNSSETPTIYTNKWMGWIQNLCWKKKFPDSKTRNKNSCGDFYCYICIKEFFDYQNPKEFVCMKCNSKCHCHKCKNLDSLKKMKKSIVQIKKKLNSFKVSRIDNCLQVDDTSFLNELVKESVLSIPKHKPNSTMIDENETPEMDLEFFSFKNFYKLKDLLKNQDEIINEGPWSASTMRNTPFNIHSSNSPLFSLNEDYFSVKDDMGKLTERNYLMNIFQNKIEFKNNLKPDFLNLLKLRTLLNKDLQKIKLIKQKAQLEIQLSQV